MIRNLRTWEFSWRMILIWRKISRTDFLGYGKSYRRDGIWSCWVSSLIPSSTEIFCRTLTYTGHCWSDEASYSPLSTPDTKFVTHLHPSYSPKCTHAYALSLPGARRLLQHLRYPPFAYSRAIDHAFSWLIESGRLRAYSIVPSAVVQRKETPSDILPGFGSERKEWLVNGVLGS